MDDAPVGELYNHRRSLREHRYCERYTLVSLLGLGGGSLFLFQTGNKARVDVGEQTHGSMIPLPKNLPVCVCLPIQLHKTGLYVYEVVDPRDLYDFVVSYAIGSYSRKPTPRGCPSVNKTLHRSLPLPMVYLRI